MLDNMNKNDKLLATACSANKHRSFSRIS